MKAHRLPDRPGHTEDSISSREFGDKMMDLGWAYRKQNEAMLLTSGTAKGLVRNTVIRSNITYSAGSLHSDEKTSI